jgi:hypothetical protein
MLLFCQSPSHAAHGNAGDFAHGVEAEQEAGRVGLILDCYAAERERSGNRLERLDADRDANHVPAQARCDLRTPVCATGCCVRAIRRSPPFRVHNANLKAHLKERI